MPVVEAKRRYSRAVCVGATKNAVCGSPEMKIISTSHVERANLTMRMGMRRFTRLTNGFSKKIEMRMHAPSLHFMHDNFARIHKSLKVTPAVEARISTPVWSIEEIVRPVAEPVAKQRGSYCPRAVKAAKFKLRHYPKLRPLFSRPDPLFNLSGEHP